MTATTSEPEGIHGGGPDVHPPLHAVREAVARALAEDVGPLGDITSALVPLDAVGHLSIVARQPGVVAGRHCAEEAFSSVDARLELCWHLDDGSAVEPGAVVAEIAGRVRSILVAERTALNFLCHLSGVATLTRRYVEAVRVVSPDVLVLDTRKTLPGLRTLQKAAVRAGGGRNHRASLSDAVLVKDNHLGSVSITGAVSAARRWWPGRLVEVECDRPTQVEEACRAGAGAVLLDNMTPEEAGRCAELARSAAGGARILIEVSGRVSLEDAPRYAAAGVDLISVGALTHSVESLDFGLDLSTGAG